MNDIRQDNLIFRVFPLFTHPYILLMRLDRPTGFMLLFYPMSISLLVFSEFNLELFNLMTLFFCGSIVMRSAGCIINDLFDRDIDKLTSRTQSRPLVTNKISITNSIICLIILLIVGLFILSRLNLTSIILGIAISPLVILYPLAKRYFIIPQLVLAITYNWGCFIAWTSIGSPSKFNLILILYLSMVIWTIIYDTVYATQDEVDDKKMFLNSSAILFGKQKTFILNCLVLIQYLLLVFLGFFLNFNFVYHIIILGIFLINTLDINLIWKNSAVNAGKYFKRNNYYGFLILMSIIIGNQIYV